MNNATIVALLFCIGVPLLCLLAGLYIGRHGFPIVVQLRRPAGRRAPAADEEEL